MELELIVAVATAVAALVTVVLVVLRAHDRRRGDALTEELLEPSRRSLTDLEPFEGDEIGRFRGRARTR